MQDIRPMIHSRGRMATILTAAVIYFAIVFACGFVLGAVRVVAIAPRLGAPIAVLIEVPLILAISWYACRWVIARFAVPAEVGPRIAMGAAAFAIVMVAEFGLSVLGFGRTALEHFAAFREAPALMGLLAQLGFAILPTVQLKGA
jgi:hypothetical protein